MEIDSEEFQKAIDETQSIIEADKKQRWEDAIRREKRELKGMEKSFEPYVDWPYVDWNYKKLGGGMGVSGARSIHNFKEITFAELNESVRSILSKSENSVTDDVLEEIGKEIEKHYIENADNHLIEILRYTLFTTVDSTATLQDYPGKFYFDCGGKQIIKNE